jgi:NDP-sugar pyrophosphorylase family protein
MSAPTPATQPEAQPELQPFSAVYLAAGLSSRFGFRVKCLQEVGRHGETLLELSVRQLQKYRVHELVMIVSPATKKHIHDAIGDRFLGLPVVYCYQITPDYRKKPMGTVHALLAAKDAVKNNFIVLNGDTLYGDNALSKVCAHVSTRANPCMPGYPLKDVLPKTGHVNRAVINMHGSMLTEIVEQYDICYDDIRSGKYTGSELTSMNIFAFPSSMFGYLQRKFDAWLDANKEEETKEYILSTMLNDLQRDEGIETSVYPVENAIPLELTNPDDFAFVRNNLDLVGL